jgi:hypothetical protein
MLRSLKDLVMYNFAASDGALGPISDFYFDDWEWCVRYIVIDTDKWLPGRKVLISPVSIGQADSAARRLHVKLTRDQIENSPGIETDKPVSRQMEVDLADYYSWPYYWGARTGGGAAAAAALADKKIDTPESGQGDSNLRSVKVVTGYHIEAKDGAIGHVEDFILDDEDWTIRYMVVDTRNWLPGKKVLIAPCLIRSVRWDQSNVHVDLPRDLVEASPEYDPSAPVNREYETRWYDYYGRPKYWT